jgi:hypothetical protein
MEQSSTTLRDDQRSDKKPVGWSANICLKRGASLLAAILMKEGVTYLAKAVGRWSRQHSGRSRSDHLARKNAEMLEKPMEALFGRENEGPDALTTTLGEANKPVEPPSSGVNGASLRSTDWRVAFS